MGGAFVAVADDSSASWWNPAGQAAGPFLDLAISGSTGTTSVSAQVPPIGASYYRFDGALNPIAGPNGDRKEGGAGVPARASHFAATLVQTLVDGVHVGLTAKYVRGGVSAAPEAGTFDLDAGVLAAIGAVRVGLAARNLRAPELAGVLLDRQIRVGVAFDAEAAGSVPAMLSLDVDLRAYEGADGRRRAIALGAERWLGGRRLGVRGGGRINTEGGRGKAMTAGMSAAVRPGLFVDVHGAAGSRGERGWGAAGRISF